MQLKSIGILGAGRQAFETAGYCREAGMEPAFFLEEVPPTYARDSEAFGAPILGFGDDIGQFGPVPLISAVGSPELRHRFVNRWTDRRFNTLVSARAWLASDVRIGPGTTVAPMAAVNRRVDIGAHVLVNVGAILSHDVALGDFSTVSPGCCIGGGVTVGRSAFLGIGSTVIDHVRIGDGAFVAAGAVVVDDVNDGEQVVGVPARPVGRGVPR